MAETQEEKEARWVQESKSFTIPLWIQNFYLQYGHGPQTRNSTGTFVKFEAKVYVVTCKHALDIVLKRNEKDPRPHWVLGSIVGRAVLNFGSFPTRQIAHAFRVPVPKGEEEQLDLAIAPMSEGYWGILTGAGKTAIDLDNWREPRWSSETLAAIGYPEEHKTAVLVGGEDKVATPLVHVIAKKFGDIGRALPLVQMQDRMAKPHGYFFSGMSGGYMATIQENHLVPAAILYEGWPQSSRAPKHKTLDDCDIVGAGYTLTPETFAGWLERAGFPVSGASAAASSAG